MSRVLPLAVFAILNPVSGSSIEYIPMNEYFGFSTCPGPVPFHDFPTTRTFKTRPGDFTVAETVALNNGMDAWSSDDARNVGWNLNLEFSGTSTTPDLGDGDNNVLMVDFADPNALTSVGFPATVQAVGVHIYDHDRTAGSCGAFTLLESDILFDANQDWDNRADWLEGASPHTDLGAVAAHEFGHHLGLWHEDDYATIMTSLVPGMGRPSGGKVSADEESVTFMRTEHGATESGKNIMITKYFLQRDDSTGGFEAREWFNGAFLRVAAGSTVRTNLGDNRTSVGADGFDTAGGPITLHNLGPTTTFVTVEYRLVLATLVDEDYEFSCTPPTNEPNANFLVRSVSVQLIPDIPTTIAGPLTIPIRDPADLGFFDSEGNYYPPVDPTNGEPAREFRLCVEVDPYDAIAETDEYDNIAISDVIIEVIP